MTGLVIRLVSCPSSSFPAQWQQKGDVAFTKPIATFTKPPDNTSRPIYHPPQGPETATCRD